MKLYSYVLEKITIDNFLHIAKTSPLKITCNSKTYYISINVTMYQENKSVCIHFENWFHVTVEIELYRNSIQISSNNNVFYYPIYVCLYQVNEPVCTNENNFFQTESANELYCNKTVFRYRFLYLWKNQANFPFLLADMNRLHVTVDNELHWYRKIMFVCSVSAELNNGWLRYRILSVSNVLITRKHIYIIEVLRYRKRNKRKTKVTKIEAMIVEENLFLYIVLFIENCLHAGYTCILQKTAGGAINQSVVPVPIDYRA